MKQALRISISLIIILVSLSLFWSIKNVELPKTGQFALITGSGVGLAAGIAILLASVYQFVSARAISVGRERKKRKELTEEEILKRLEEGLMGAKPKEMESKLVLRAGSIAAYLKRRGTSMGRLSESGQYATYERWAKVLKKEAERLVEKYPTLGGRYSVVNAIARTDVYRLSELLEDFSHLYEAARLSRTERIPPKYLKRLAYTIEHG